MRIAGLVAGCDLRARWHHNENDVTVITAGRRYGDWRHVATGCNALAFTTRKTAHDAGRCVALRCVPSWTQLRGLLATARCMRWSSLIDHCDPARSASDIWRWEQTTGKRHGINDVLTHSIISAAHSFH